METLPGLGTHLRAGLLERAIALLQNCSSIADRVSRVEVAFQVGDTTNAVVECRSLLRDSRLSPTELSRCTAVLAEYTWGGGDLTTGLELYHRAYSSSRTV